MPLMAALSQGCILPEGKSAHDPERRATPSAQQAVPGSDAGRDAETQPPDSSDTHDSGTPPEQPTVETETTPDPVPDEDAGVVDPCPKLPMDQREELDPKVEDLGLSYLKLPDGWDTARPGPATDVPGSSGRNYWLLSRPTTPNTVPDETPTNQPTALRVVNLVLDGMPTVVAREPFPNEPVGLPFVSLTATDPAGSALWPSASIWNSKLNAGMSFLRRLAPDEPTQVQVALFQLESSVASAAPTTLFSGADPLFATGAYSSLHQIYLYACAENEAEDPSSDQRYACSLARASADSAQQRASYEVLVKQSPARWSADLTQGVPVLFGGEELSVFASSYLNGKKVAIHLHPKTGKLHVQTARQPWEHWETIARVDLPQPPGTGQPTSAYLLDTNTCVRRMIIAYALPTLNADPEDPASSHLHLAAISWR